MLETIDKLNDNKNLKVNHTMQQPILISFGQKSSVFWKSRCEIC